MADRRLGGAVGRRCAELGRGAQGSPARSRSISGWSRWTSPFIDECERLIEPQEAEAILRRDLPPSQINSTSDDYTDMSWHAPTARFYVARPVLKVAATAIAYPAWVMNALGGIPATIDPMVGLRVEDHRATRRST